MKKKLLIIASHLSTGGLPQVALKRIELLKDKYDVYVMEYRQLAYRYVVQRNKIIELLGDNFISLGRPETEEKRDKFEYFFNSIKADVVHMEEIPELFMKDGHADIVYNKNRTYKLFETTHTTTFNVNNKKYFPDKFLFMSSYSEKEYSKFNIPSQVIEYPIDNIKKEREKYINELNLESDYFHILNVGLFTKDKNQGYLFEMAKKLEDYKIKFNFIGNQADNFKTYWKPLLDDKPDNCNIFGERDDVYKFYHACNLLIFPSKLELNPLVIKEALSYNLPIFMNKLDVLSEDYNIQYLSGDIDNDISLLFSKFNIQKKYINSNDFKKLLIENYDDIKKIENNNETINSNDFKKLLIDNYDDIKKIENNNETKNKEGFNYNINFIDCAKVEILGKKDSEEKFKIQFIDKDADSLEYETIIKPNSWSKTNIRYYKNWRVVIKKDDKIIVKYDMNLKGKNVHIKFESKSLGDNLAFIPYVEEFRKKHECNIFCSTFWNNLYEKEYTEISFIKPGEKPNKEIYAAYSFGWFQPWRMTHNPNDYKKIPLQKTASDILGLEFKEIVPKITAPEGVRPIEEKYVCIAQFSTANAKHWHFPYKNSILGWQMVVDWLNKQGYKVMVISKQQTKLKNIIDKTGDFPIEHRINELKHCEFFIGIGSGLSWLAWILKKKVVMISGFSDPICEFKENNIRVHNYSVCNGCFNRHEFDRGDWDWCPDNKNTEKQFECSLNITPNMVIDKIISSGLVENQTEFNFNDYFIKSDDIKIDEGKLNITYEKQDNKIIMVYDSDLPKLNIDVIDLNTDEIYHNLCDVVLSDKYIVWIKPKTNISEKNIYLRFYTDKTILKFKLKN